MSLKYAGLFEGIGGFALAAQWAGFTPVWSNEIDPFCCKVLRKNFNHEIIEADIRDCGKGRKHELRPVDIICGGFPCQPFSVAGKREAEKDDRHLWPEKFRIITELRPRLVVAENVPGIITISGGLVFEQVCADLESEGYEVQPLIIPACAVDAPHRRDRVWIVAHANDYGPYGAENRQSMGKGDDTNTAGQVEAVKPSRRAISKSGFITNSAYRNDWQHFREPEKGQTPEFGNDIEQGVTANANSKRFKKRNDAGFTEGQERQLNKKVLPLENWQDFPTQSPVCGGNDGVSTELHIINRIIEYYEKNSDKMGSEESKSETCIAIWKIMRTMWEQREVAKTSRDIYISRLYDSMPEVSCENGSETWMEKIEEEKELCDMWKSFYSKPFQEAQDLQQRMLKYIREAERRKKMEKKQRSHRIKSLGNAIVPQVAFEIFKAIKSITNS